MHVTLERQSLVETKNSTLTSLSCEKCYSRQLYGWRTGQFEWLTGNVPHLLNVVRLAYRLAQETVPLHLNADILTAAEPICVIVWHTSMPFCPEHIWELWFFIKFITENDATWQKQPGLCFWWLLRECRRKMWSGAEPVWTCCWRESTTAVCREKGREAVHERYQTVLVRDVICVEQRWKLAGMRHWWMVTSS